MLRILNNYGGLLLKAMGQTLLLALGGIFFGVRLLSLLPLMIFELMLFLFVQPCFADEPAAKDNMKKMPDSNDGVLTGRFENYRACLAAGYIVFSSMTAYLVGRGVFRIVHAPGGRDGITMAFAAMALGLTLHAFCSRSERLIVTAGIFGNLKLLLGVLLTAAAVVLMIVVPQASVLMGFNALSAMEWYCVGGLLLIQLIVWEYPKLYASVKF